MSTDILNLNDIWVLWYHLSSDNNWNIDSYKKITEISSVDETCHLTKNLNDTYICNCMFFLMKKGLILFGKIQTILTEDVSLLKYKID